MIPPPPRTLRLPDERTPLFSIFPLKVWGFLSLSPLAILRVLRCNLFPLRLKKRRSKGLPPIVQATSGGLGRHRALFPFLKREYRVYSSPLFRGKSDCLTSFFKGTPGTPDFPFPFSYRCVVPPPLLPIAGQIRAHLISPTNRSRKFVHVVM